MKLYIAKRQLYTDERAQLATATISFPNIGFISKDLWTYFKTVYVATTGKNFIGVCVVIPLHGWIKLGPMVILKKYHGQGYGKELLN